MSQPFDHRGQPEIPTDRRVRELFVVGRIATGAMVLALFLPWVGLWWESSSLMTLGVRFFQQVGQIGLWAVFKEFWVGVITFSAFLLPVLAAVMAAGASLPGVDKETKTDRPLGEYGAAGVVGLIGVAEFFVTFKVANRDGSELGIGFLLFTMASITLVWIAVRGKRQSS